MASVFLSYDRDDGRRAKHFARALEDEGHEVWWDLNVRGGAQFSKIIEEALKTADTVVVLWSVNSVESAWVRDEAAAGRDSGRLLPVTIDGTEPPLGFRQFQTIDLRRWKGRGSPPGLRSLLADVAALGSASKEAAPAKRSGRPPVRPNRTALILASAAILITGFTVSLFWWRPWEVSGQPTLAVHAASKDPASESLAHDLSVSLASLQAIKTNSIRLVSETEAARRRPDLSLDVGTNDAAAGSAASVVLTNTKDGTIFWSGDFNSNNPADLKQQLALSTGRVVACADEAMARRQRIADQETLKLYLNACSELGDLNLTGNSEPLVTAFRQVVSKSPRFVPAWSKLLLVEADQFETDSEDGSSHEADASLIRQHIAAARLLSPQMAEATLAEASLIPIENIAKRIQALDRAKSAAPDDPAILSERSALMRSVGRMIASIEDSKHAIQTDPISPALRGAYVDALAFAGQVDSARQEIEDIDRLWPDTSTARDLEFRFNLRFGDPQKALPEARRQALKGLILYLEARIDPSKVPSYVAWLVNRKDYDYGRLGVLVQALGEFHDEEQLYDVLSKWPNPHDLSRLGDVWFRPGLERFREDPRFIQVMARTPLLNYWKSSGQWPDFCFSPDLPYDCKKEAAKLNA